MARKSVRDLLASVPAAMDALAAEERDRKLLDLARKRLPPEDRAHCINAGLADNRLILTFDSPAWTSRARYRAGEIAASLGFAEVKVRTRPRVPPKTQRRLRRQRVPPTPAVIAGLLAAADGIRDPGLGDALRRLAKHLSDNDPRH